MIPTHIGALAGLYLACASGFPAPEEITLLSTGAWVTTGQIPLMAAVLVGWAGVLTSDWSLFFLGRHLGPRVAFLPVLRNVLTEPRILRAEALIRSNGPFWCAAARFIPGMRIVIFATMGSLGLTPRVFMTIDAMTSLISVFLWIWAGNSLASHLTDATQYAAEIKLALAAIAMVYLTINMGWKLLMKKGNP